MPQPDAYLEARLHRRRRVEDVMTTAVVTVDRLTPYKEIARLLTEHEVSSLPVLAGGWQVIGVVSETGLLAARDSVARWGHTARRRAGRSRLDEMPFHDPADVIVTVRHGVVTLTGVGRPKPGRHQDLIPAVIRLIWDVDGVVDVGNRLGRPPV